MTTSARTPQYVFAENATNTQHFDAGSMWSSTPTDAFLNLKLLDKPEFEEQ